MSLRPRPADVSLAVHEDAQVTRWCRFGTTGGVAVLTLIEVALAVRGQRELPHDDEDLLTVDMVGALVDDERASWLLAQVDRVLSPGSEVYELWREAGDETLHEWLSNANAAVSDLRHELGSSLSTDITSGSTGDV